MADDRNLDSRYIATISATVRPIFTKFGTLMHIDTVNPTGLNVVGYCLQDTVAYAKEHMPVADAYWCNLANTIESFVFGGDAAFCQITLTTCFYHHRGHHHHHYVWPAPFLFHFWLYIFGFLCELYLFIASIVSVI